MSQSAPDHGGRGKGGENSSAGRICARGYPWRDFAGRTFNSGTGQADHLSAVHGLVGASLHGSGT